MEKFDAVVIGGGPGGYACAIRLAQNGLRAALVEADTLGGTCLNRGCIPTKTLLHASQVYHDAANGASVGVHGALTYDMGEMFAFKRSVSEKLRGGILSLLKSAKVDVIEGTAQITAPGQVSVTGADGARTAYTAERILAATGSVNVRPPIPGLELPGVMTSDELLEGTDTPYASIVIIGGGVIGVEFATFYSHLGCRVTLVEGMANLLPQLDRELGQNLAQILKKQGVEVLTSAMVRSLEQTGEGLCVHLEQKGKELTVTGEKVLCAIGRRAYFEGLFAPDLNPALNGKRLLVDEDYRTSIPGVYAIGDASAAVQLAHVAAAQGTDCVERMCGGKGSTDLNVLPSCIYSAPEIAVVGLTEAEAKEQGIPAVSGKCTLFSNARTIIEDPGRCFMKLVARSDTREIIGAQLMCQHASDMISQLSTAMVNHLTARQLLSVMRPHPSFEEALSEAVENLTAKLA